MKTETTIIRHLLDTKHAVTIRELARRIGSDYRITHTAVQRLIGKGVLHATTVGKSTLCRLAPDHDGPDIRLAEEERKEEALQDKNLHKLHDEVIGNMGTSFFVLLLFGSHAKGTATKESDIDLLLITDDEEAEERLHEKLSLLPLKTHAIAVTEEEFVRMNNAKETNVVKEAVKHNIPLYGVEPYYRMKNA
ncbi:nucleotidyltransferase domain-containing protein [Candidatus Woesearchaeota archaeon]|nr:nucleotidyltransferase domain-containing protein [Candidatus Woesearchaeota archaeon]